MISGFPEYGKETEGLVLASPLTSAAVLPNATGVTGGSAVAFDSVLGMKSLNTSATNTDNLFQWLGPYSSAPLTAWAPSAADERIGKMSAGSRFHHGYMMRWEIHSDAFEPGVIEAREGTDATVLAEFRGAANSGLVRMARGGTISAGGGGNVLSYVSRIDTQHTGMNIGGSAGYVSDAANNSDVGTGRDKSHLELLISVRPHVVDIYLERHLIYSNTVDQTSTTSGMDSLWFPGRRSITSGTQNGFPFYIRNWAVYERPLILVPHPRFDRIVWIGDSNVVNGDYFASSPKEEATHSGGQGDGGFCPFLERLMHNDGIYTSDIHNSGEVGARVLFVSAGKAMVDQIDGTYDGTVFDAFSKDSRIAIIHCGQNDITNETTTATAIKAEMRSHIQTLFANGFRDIVLNTVPDVQNYTSATNSQSVIVTRTTDVNTAYTELANEFGNVHLCDAHAAMGGVQDSANFATDQGHYNARGHVLIAREVYEVLKDNVFNK